MMRYENPHYRSVFKVPPTEWCQVMLRRTKANKLVKAFLDIVRERIPASVQHCPMDGKVEVSNMQLRNKMLSIFPTGMYKFSVRAYNDDDSNVFSLALTVRAES